MAMATEDQLQDQDQEAAEGIQSDDQEAMGTLGIGEDGQFVVTGRPDGGKADKGKPDAKDAGDQGGPDGGDGKADADADAKETVKGAKPSDNHQEMVRVMIGGKPVMVSREAAEAMEAEKSAADASAKDDAQKKDGQQERQTRTPEEQRETYLAHIKAIDEELDLALDRKDGSFSETIYKNLVVPIVRPMQKQLDKMTTEYQELQKQLSEACNEIDALTVHSRIEQAIAPEIADDMEVMGIEGDAPSPADVVAEMVRVADDPAGGKYAVAFDANGQPQARERAFNRLRQVAIRNLTAAAKLRSGEDSPTPDSTKPRRSAPSAAKSAPGGGGDFGQAKGPIMPPDNLSGRAALRRLGFSE